MWNKQPCVRQVKGGIPTASWCDTHDQDIWTCVEMLRKNMYRVRDLYEEKIKLIAAIQSVDKMMQVEGGEN